MIIQMLQKFMKITSTPEQAENTKSAERQKTSFPNEYVENTDLYEPILHKIMATIFTCDKVFIKYGSVKNNYQIKVVLKIAFKDFKGVLLRLISL